MTEFRSENLSQQLSSSLGETAAMLQAMDAEELHRYARKPSLAAEPVRTLAGIAVEEGIPLSNRTGQIVLRDVGFQLDPEAEYEASPEMALFLRRSTGEGVYPHLISAKDSWELAADVLSVNGEPLRSHNAQFLLTCAWVSRQSVVEAVDISMTVFAHRAAAFLHALYRQPEQQRQLGDRAAEALSPLVLPDIPEGLWRNRQLTRMAREVFGRADAPLFLEAPSVRQTEVVDAMSLRYLDRPRIMTTAHDPWGLIDKTRRFCSGHSVAEIENSDYNTGLRKLLNRMFVFFKQSLAPEDVEEIWQFLAGDSDQVVLQRSEPIDVGFAAKMVKKRERDRLQKQRDRAAAAKNRSPGISSLSTGGGGATGRNLRSLAGLAGLDAPVSEARLRLDKVFGGIGSKLGLEERDARSLLRFADATVESSAVAAKKLEELLADIAPDMQQAVDTTELDDLYKQVAEAFFGLNGKTVQSPAALAAGSPELKTALEAAQLTAEMCLIVFCEDWLKKL